MNRRSILLNGIWKENPVLVMTLGMCPTLAVTTGAQSALGMGLATTFVLICSNLVVSMIRRFVNASIRIPAYIVVIAGFVTVVELVLKGFVPVLYDALGLYLSLIVVNCIILGRAELFASKNKCLNAALDGLGMGVGFTLALFVMGSIRELLGTGCLFSIPVTENLIDPMTIFILPAGGFFVLGMLIAVFNRLNRKKKKGTDVGCASCPMSCHGAKCESSSDGKGCDKR